MTVKGLGPQRRKEAHGHCVVAGLADGAHGAHQPGVGESVPRPKMKFDKSPA